MPQHCCITYHFFLPVGRPEAENNQKKEGRGILSPRGAKLRVLGDDAEALRGYPRRGQSDGKMIYLPVDNRVNIDSGVLALSASAPKLALQDQRYRDQQQGRKLKGKEGSLGQEERGEDVHRWLGDAWCQVETDTIGSSNTAGTRRGRVPENCEDSESRNGSRRSSRAAEAIAWPSSKRKGDGGGGWPPVGVAVENMNCSEQQTIWIHPPCKMKGRKRTSTGILVWIRRSQQLALWRGATGGIKCRTVHEERTGATGGKCDAAQETVHNGAPQTAIWDAAQRVSTQAKRESAAGDSMWEERRTNIESHHP
ncbi:hypothetical protein DFH07DRAFT_770502 [Mycena maculata]|uniref:Uncharacterized protein n=1 Tax=Mycena maculata TaxID=230809 RepID=A0AAD7NKD9_9AGAR|nr:hypothetical protein DFH07DRAFT_770502 [Mycena maculata]